MSYESDQRAVARRWTTAGAISFALVFIIIWTIGTGMFLFLVGTPLAIGGALALAKGLDRS